MLRGSPSCPRVAILCSGLDAVGRGYEAHSRLLFEQLASDPAVACDALLVKGSGASGSGEVVIHSPRRHGWLCRNLARLRGDALYWEYLLFGLGFLIRSVVHRDRFDSIACIEPMVSKVLMRTRKLLPGSPRITFTHGVWMEPPSYAGNGDCIHEVNIENFNRLGSFSATSHRRIESVCIPHFIPDLDPGLGPARLTRESVGLQTPLVALAVGVLDSNHKRTDHVIREVANLGESWSLLACGQPKGADGERVAMLGRQLLGHRFVNISLPRDRVWEAYQLADVFVLGSLNEGFGLVLLEAMRAGLPVLAHDRPLFRWILGDERACVPMDRTGALAKRLADLASAPDEMRRLGSGNRREFLGRFTWGQVRDQYVRMLLGPAAHFGRS